MIVGPKRSGKGTVARVLTALLGQDNVASPTLAGLGQNFGLAPLLGKRVAIVSDARLSGKADQQAVVERLLNISGEDSITIDRKYREPVTSKLDARFLILTNELPRLADSSGALASRFITLVMKESFIGREDHGLLGRIMPELPGILNWSIAGWRRLRDRGYFVPPASSRETQEEMEDLGSPIGAFLRERCVIGPGLQVAPADLFKAWNLWCHENGRTQAGNTQSFGRDLRAAVPGLSTPRTRAGGGPQVRHYEGVALDRAR